MITDIVAAGILTGCSILIVAWMFDDMLNGIVNNLLKPVKQHISQHQEEPKKRRAIRHQ